MDGMLREAHNEGRLEAFKETIDRIHEEKDREKEMV
jgi:hypothetical protein